MGSGGAKGRRDGKARAAASEGFQINLMASEQDAILKKQLLPFVAAACSTVGSDSDHRNPTGWVSALVDQAGSKASTRGWRSHSGCLYCKGLQLLEQ